MKGGPTPSIGTPPAPLSGWLFRVAYVSQRGETFSKLYRQQAAAERFARKVLDHGGQPRLDEVRLAGWHERSIPAATTDCTARSLSHWTEPEPTP